MLVQLLPPGNSPAGTSRTLPAGRKAADAASTLGRAAGLPPAGAPAGGRPGGGG